jgi:DNA end-binding protein Ku
MIEDKTKGRKPAKVAEPEDTNVVDLMAALRASLAAKTDNGEKAPAKSSAAKPRRRKAS